MHSLAPAREVHKLEEAENEYVREVHNGGRVVAGDFNVHESEMRKEGPLPSRKLD